MYVAQTKYKFSLYFCKHLWQKLFFSVIDFNENSMLLNDFGGVMVSVLVSSVVDRGYKPWSGQTKERWKTGWLGIRIMCPVYFVSAATSLYLLTVVSVNYHYKNATKYVGLVQSGPHHHLMKN
jgi:hypothetical protein